MVRPPVAVNRGKREMSNRDKTDVALLAAPNTQSSANAARPLELAAQAEYEAGYKEGWEAGYREAFSKSIAAGQCPNRALTRASKEGEPAPKTGLRRMLLGMPCRNCGVYLLSHETHCPCCRQLVKEC
jgi:hypothetical protein